MTDHEIIEFLARQICMDTGADPDKFENVFGGYGPYGYPLPWFAPDGIQHPWHKHIKEATYFLRLHRAMKMLESIS